MRELPLVAVLTGVAVGLVAVALDRWQLGSACIGVAVALAGGLRLALPTRAAGLLAVRSRTVDAAVLLVLGTGLVVLAGSVPTG